LSTLPPAGTACYAYPQDCYAYLTACPKRVEHAKLYFFYLFVRTAALRRASLVGWNSYFK
jgi:hypothetical protein